MSGLPQGADAAANLAADSEGRLAELIDELDSLCTGEDWRLDVGVACSILGVDPGDYYRFAYAHEGIGEAGEDFGPHNAEALALYAEALGLKDATAQLEATGYYLSVNLLARWTESFLSITMNHLRHVEVEQELLESAVAGCRHFEDAVLFYCEAKFSKKRLLDLALSRFIESAALRDEPYLRFALRSYLKERLRVREISWDVLFATAEDFLEEKAVQWGYAVRREQVEYRLNLAPELCRALDVLGLDQDAVPKEKDLKAAYYAGVKRWHPDRNADGQERTRELNEAYATAQRFLFMDGVRNA